MSDALPLRRRAAAAPAEAPAPDAPAAPDVAVLARLADLLRTDGAAGSVEPEGTAGRSLT